MNNIRLLRNDEIEVRVQSFNSNSNNAIFLLYKDARCDMRILDEVFGIDGWEREHQLIDGKLFCTVRVWSNKRNAWISKQDVGTESNTEKEKGQASDAFKRACFNWGIGRELYTAPLISVKCTDKDLYNNKCTLKLEVKHIAYNDNREISELVLVDRFGNERYNWKNGKAAKVQEPAKVSEPVKAKEEPVASTNNTEGAVKAEKTISEAQNKRLYAIANKAGIKADAVLKVIKNEFNLDSSLELNATQYKVICDRLEAKAKATA